ncbi:tRNA dihydrouridine synthase DusB [candidate division KSB1 bacterium]|nr:MAG: tRNA dihydrouridine synthase DusB [candidate division KSB1 bacterium]
MNIGNLRLDTRSMLAPMAGAADRAFRLTVKKFGVGLMFSELISSDGLLYASPRTEKLCEILDDERPFGLQIFGSDPAVMEQAARLVEKYKPDLIDINFGCPVKKVVKRGAGAALLKDLDTMYEIASKVVGAVSVPVFAKIRSGWDADSINAVEAAKLLEQAGVEAVTVHARTRSMGYSGRADWNIIKDVKQAVSIPVIGNGDITDPESAERMILQTGCDFVMVGRGAFGKPWIFRQIDALLSEKEIIPEPEDPEKIDICISHFNLAVKMLGRERGVKEMRKHIGWYVKGMRNSAGLRGKVFSLTDPEQVIETLMEFRSSLVRDA